MDLILVLQVRTDEQEDRFANRLKSWRVLTVGSDEIEVGLEFEDKT